MTIIYIMPVYNIMVDIKIKYKRWNSIGTHVINFVVFFIRLNFDVMTTEICVVLSMNLHFGKFHK